MTILEQTLSDKSLKIIKKTLFSEAIKLKRKTKEILPYRKIYRANAIHCETAYNLVLEAMDFYGLTNQEEITQ